jgi:hypothetical protein
VWHRKLKKILDKIKEADEEHPVEGALAGMAEDAEDEHGESGAGKDPESQFHKPTLTKTSSNAEFSDFIAGKGELDPGNETIHLVANGKDIYFQVMSEEEFITTSISGPGVHGIELEIDFFSLLDESLSTCSEFFKRVEFECYTRMNECEQVAKFTASELEKLMREVDEVKETKDFKKLKKVFASRKLEIERHKNKLTIAYKDLFRKLCLLKRSETQQQARCRTSPSNGPDVAIRLLLTGSCSFCFGMSAF